jgi:predicted RNase H-like HicB family nuclease
MKVTVMVHESSEGYAASCPALPGRHSRGAKESKDLENIRIAVNEYL